MNWYIRTRRMWRNGLTSEIDVNTYIGKNDNMDAVFLVLAHYDRKGNIKKYSAWVQNRNHLDMGGENFGLKIKNCSTYKEGMTICEQYYQNFIDGNESKSKVIGTQYFDDDILASDGNYLD